MILRLYSKAQVWRAATSARVLEDRGATAVEYALMLALIFMVIIAAVAFLGQSTNASFEKRAVPVRSVARTGADGQAGRRRRRALEPMRFARTGTGRAPPSARLRLP